MAHNSQKSNLRIASGTPSSTTNSLYNISGTLYWNGSAIGSGLVLPSGTTANAVLKWNGSSWVESTELLLNASSVVGIFSGAIRLGTSTDATAGNVRWNGTNFQGYNGSSYIRLDLQLNDFSATGNIAFDNTTGVISEATGFKLVGNGTVANTTLRWDTGTSAWIEDLNYKILDSSSTNFGAWKGTTAISTGIDNTFFGNDILNAVTSGNGNTIMGYQAGKSITNSEYNTLIGYQAGKLIAGSNSTYCTIVGAASGESITSARRNVIIGARNGQSLVTGGDNTIIGYQNCNSLTASDNIVIGNTTATALSTGSTNIIIGQSTGLNVTTGSFNISIGSQNTLQTSSTNTITLGNSVTVNGNNRLVIGGLSHNITDIFLGENDQTSNSINANIQPSERAGGTNQSGGNLRIRGQRSTGTGIGGSVQIQVSDAGSSGGTQNTFVDKLVVSSTTTTFSTGEVHKIATTTTTPYTALATDMHILSNVASASVLNLISGPETGRSYHIKKISGPGKNVVITPASGNIDGSATLTLNTQYQSVNLVFDGTDWWSF